MKVCKFGGSSLADAEQIKKVCSIIKSDPERRIIVTSAPGKRKKGEEKVTDLLIACGKRRISGKFPEKEFNVVVTRFAEIQKELGLPSDITDNISKDLKKRVNADCTEKARFLDQLKAGG